MSEPPPPSSPAPARRAEIPVCVLGSVVVARNVVLALMAGSRLLAVTSSAADSLATGGGSSVLAAIFVGPLYLVMWAAYLVGLGLVVASVVLIVSRFGAIERREPPKASLWMWLFAGDIALHLSALALFAWVRIDAGLIAGSAVPDLVGFCVAYMLRLRTPFST